MLTEYYHERKSSLSTNNLLFRFDDITEKITRKVEGIVRLTVKVAKYEKDYFIEV